MEVTTNGIPIEAVKKEKRVSEEVKND